MTTTILTLHPVNVVHSHWTPASDLTCDAVVTDPPPTVQADPDAIDALLHTAHGHMAMIGRADTMPETMAWLDPERVCVWWPHNATSTKHRAGVGYSFYPVYLWGILPYHDGPVVDLWPIEQTEGTGHPGEKPVGLLEAMIRLVCPAGGLVLDPFAGSGTALVAARNTGRRGLGVEHDERWVDHIKERIT
jgi:hypothetical protein